MLSLIRKGPQGMSLKLNSHIPEIKHKLAAWGSLVSFTPETAISRYGPTRCLIFLSACHNGETINETYVSENTMEFFLTSLINSHMTEGVDSASMLPGSIMMRLMGNIDRGIEAIHRDLGGEVIDRDPIYRPDIPGTSSLIYFTRKSLTKTIRTEEMHESALLVHSRSKEALVQYLTARDIEYLGDALGTPDWNDVEIKICDSDKLFDLQRLRLLTVIHGMQVGIVLEERWEKEQALVHRRLPVYMIKLYTPLEVQAIKRLAMGLEYNAAGKRFVDLDVYHNDRKISAFTELNVHPGMTRNDIGMMNRNEIMKNIDIDSLNELLRIEWEINNIN